MFCTQCGSKSSGGNFCGNCGAKFTQTLNQDSLQLQEFIIKAKHDFPNGFQDYVEQNGDKTNWWVKHYKSNNLVEEINGYRFDHLEMAKMSQWDNEKWWTFMGYVDFEFHQSYPNSKS